MDHLTDATTTSETAARRARRTGRAASVVVAAVLALGVGAGVSACSNDAAPAQDKVAAANAAASKQADATGDAYQALAASIATGVDLLAASQGKVSDDVLSELSSALDAARAIDPTTSFRDLDTVAEAQTKQQALATAAQQMTDAKTTLDNAVKAVQTAAAG